MNSRWYKTLGIGIPVINVFFLFGISKAIFGLELSSNLFHTSLQPSLILAILNSFLLYAIYKGNI
jgi:hypothetical protein